MSNRVVFTNVFTVQGVDVSANPYVEMMGIWHMFLKSFGGLGPEDKIMLVMDEATHAFMRGTGRWTTFSRAW